MVCFPVPKGGSSQKQFEVSWKHFYGFVGIPPCVGDLQKKQVNLNLDELEPADYQFLVV